MKKYNRALNWTVQALAELRAGKPVTTSTFEKHILARKLLNFPDRPAFKVQRFKSKVTKTFRLKSGTFMDKGDENPIHQALKRFKFKIAQKTKTQTDDAKITHIRWERGPVTVQETVSVYEDETLVKFLLVTPASAVESMKLEAKMRLLSSNTTEASKALGWLKKAFTVAKSYQLSEDDRSLGEGTVEFKEYTYRGVSVTPILTLAEGRLILDFNPMLGRQRMNDDDEFVAKSADELTKKVLRNLKSFVTLQERSGSSVGTQESDFCKRVLQLLS